MTRVDPLFLIGYMAAGKSTLGAMLALLMGLPFKDLDREIVAATGSTISDLFTKGESHFREAEERILREIVDGGFQGILALGAGLPAQPGMLSYLEERGRCLFLDPDFELLLRRIEMEEESSPTHRPLAVPRENETKEAWRKRLYDHWAERRLVYQRLASPVSVREEDDIPLILDRLLDAVSLSTKRGNR